MTLSIGSRSSAGFQLIGSYFQQDFACFLGRLDHCIAHAMVARLAKVPIQCGRCRCRLYQLTHFQRNAQRLGTDLAMTVFNPVQVGAGERDDKLPVVVAWISAWRITTSSCRSVLTAQCRCL